MKLILNLDDSLNDVELTKFCLRKCGIHNPVLHAISVAHAFKILEEHSCGCRDSYIGIILVDIKLPGADGFDFLFKLRDSVYKSIPAIVISGSMIEADRLRAFELGARGFLTKDSDLEQFARNIADVLSNVRPHLD